MNSRRIYTKPDTKVIDLINDNYSSLLILQHFNIDFAAANKTVRRICDEYQVNVDAFILICNLYNDFYPEKNKTYSIEAVKTIIYFLKRNHIFYKEEKYPELMEYIIQMDRNQGNEEMKLIKSFFDVYYNEVKEHLDYEDKIVFPYFDDLLNNKKSDNKLKVKDYKTHHTDIETKLSDLKNLFLKYLITKDSLNLKRKFLVSLKELEYDLLIHSALEELVLIPTIEKIEQGKK